MRLPTSRSLEEIQHYLELFSKQLSNLPDYYPFEKFSFDQIRQKVKISQNRLFYDQERNAAREIARRSGVFEENGNIRQIKLEVAYHWRVSEMYDDQSTQQDVVIGWDDIRNKIDRIIVLGDPGFGKSWLLKYEGRYIAQEQMALLKEHKIEINEIQLPLHVRLATLAEALEKMDSNFLEAILSIIQHEYNLSNITKQWMKLYITTSKCTLLLDALDEVAVDKKQNLINILKNWSEHVECRIILTSRIAGYKEAPFILRSNDLNQKLETRCI